MTPDALVFLPGIMGSELLDANDAVVWGLKPSLLFKGNRLRTIISRLAVTNDPDLDLHPGAPISFPGWLPILDGIEPYEKILRKLGATALRPEAVLGFGYDWRKSVEYNATQLQAAVNSHMGQWRETFAQIPVRERGRDEPRVTFVCHSMGGLVARWYATFLDNELWTRRIITLGTPFGGSVKAARLIATGEIWRFGILAEPLRDVARTMPGVYDLLPTYPCIESGSALRPPTVDDIAALGAERLLAADAAARAAGVRGATASQAQVRSLVGASQPTLLTWTGSGSKVEFLTTINGRNLGGDSTVFAGSAFTEGDTPSGYLPQKHGSLARTDEAVAFVRAVLAEDELRQFQATDGAGLAVPGMATTGQPIELEVTSWDGGASIVVQIAESGVSVAKLTPTRRDGRMIATTTIERAGLYRIVLIAGSHSDVSEIIGVTGHEDAEMMANATAQT